MAGFFELFRRGFDSSKPSEDIVTELKENRIEESGVIVRETPIMEDRSQSPFLDGDIQAVFESVVDRSPDTIAKILDSNSLNADQLINGLKSAYSLDDTFRENEEMSKDSIVGSAMELVTDDVCQVNEKYGTIVHVASKDTALAKFLEEFLENNVNIEERIWEWCYEVVKHGDFKLRRREYRNNKDEIKGDGKAEGKDLKDVYYENVFEPYKVARIEYMGRIIGYLDGEMEEGKTTFEKPEVFVHFLNSKLPRREKVKLKVKNKEGKMDDVYCARVNGVSLMDNARYIYRIVNLLDNMLIMSRVARSTQYNLIKIEVGGASASKTQEILSDVRRRIEGSTKLGKNKGIKSDPSPIPVNSNVYIPTREGKGDVQIESVNETVDVRSITDIDYFRNKEFATIKVPKSYMGFEEELPGSMGNSSLVKLDIRYARPVQKVQTIIRYGIEELCNNYLRYRGRPDDVGKFEIVMRMVMSAEVGAKVEEFVSNMQVFDSTANMVEAYGDYIDKAKLFKTMTNLVGLEPEDIGNQEYLKILKGLESGDYKESVKKEAVDSGDDEGGW